jgi:glycosyltransferase involved in cell wall biosynthesis
VTESTAPLVSINVPCYNQLDLARCCVDSILAQSFERFELTLLDDGASDAYRDYVASIGDARVRYQRNPIRLGPMRNMFGAMTVGRGKYVLAFHEDDLLEPRYIETAVDWLEGHPACGFVACAIREFHGEPRIEAAAAGDPVCEAFAGGADFLRGIFRGVDPMFGSIVYRRCALEGVEPQHDAFAPLVDRPFLLSILERWSCAVITAPPMAWYRRHGEGDARHLAMTTDHVLRLFERYRATLPQPLSPEDESLFYTYTGYWLLALFELVPPAKRAPIRQFLLAAFRKRLYTSVSARRSGRKRLLRGLIFNRLQVAK